MCSKLLVMAIGWDKVAVRLAHVPSWLFKVRATGGFGDGMTEQWRWVDDDAQAQQLAKALLADGRVTECKRERTTREEAYCLSGHRLPPGGGPIGCNDCPGHKVWHCSTCRADCYDPPPCERVYQLP